MFQTSYSIPPTRSRPAPSLTFFKPPRHQLTDLHHHPRQLILAPTCHLPRPFLVIDNLRPPFRALPLSPGYYEIVRPDLARIAKRYRAQPVLVP